jgi:4-amino-4-deoxy-L-arabinose transferase-like glycosyltransferase
MSIASGWDTLGSETPHVPMIQSALFGVACAGLCATALARMKSIGQAALGLAVLWGTPAVVNEGARELADLPLAYFFLATAILIYLYILRRQPGLLILAGVTAGLGAWMKNEGSVFVLAAGLALLVVSLREKPWRALLWYAAGIAIPMVVVLYFRLFMAPPSDVLSNSTGQSLAQALDLSRHVQILRAFGGELLHFGGWSLLELPVGVFIVLLVYLALAHEPKPEAGRQIAVVTILLIAVQMLGYYAVYVITPYDLTWHLRTSVERVFLQVFALAAFAVLYFTRTPESIFESQ